MSSEKVKKTLLRVYDLDLRVLVIEIAGGVRLEPLEFAWWNTSRDLGTGLKALVAGIRRLLDCGESCRLRTAPVDLVAALEAGNAARLHIRHTVRA